MVKFYSNDTLLPAWRDLSDQEDKKELKDATKDLPQNIGRSFAWCCVIKVHLACKQKVKAKLKNIENFIQVEKQVSK